MQSFVFDGGGHREEVIAERSWTQAVRGSSPLPYPWNAHLLPFPARSCLKDAAWGQSCVVETVWVVYTTKPS